MGETSSFTRKAIAGRRLTSIPSNWRSTLQGEIARMAKELMAREPDPSADEEIEIEVVIRRRPGEPGSGEAKPSRRPPGA